MRIAVVGGGVAGLTAAHRLVERWPDAEVVVLEASRRAGGVLETARDGGWIHEHAANAFLSGPPDGAVALCRELGVPVEEASSAAKRRWIYIDGALRALPAGPVDALRSELVSWRGKLHALAEPLRGKRALAPDGEHDESVWDFAARRLGPEVARAVVAPFVTGVFAGDARQISVVAGFPRIAALEADGGLVRGGVKRMRAGGPRGARPRLTAPVGGVEAMITALATRLGARVRTGVEVETVTPVRGGVDVGGERFDGVVLALPAWAAAPVLTAVPALRDAVAAIDYAPIAIAYLGYARAAVPHPSTLDGFGFLVAEGEAPRLLGAVFESVLWSSRAPDGHVLIRCILGGTRDPGALARDDAALLGQARDALGQVLGVREAPVHTRVLRWQHGVAQYRLGHGQRVTDADALARAQRIVLAGSAYHGVAVNDCIADARRVVEEVSRWA